MIRPKNELDVLTGLGLTGSQAKVYLALIQKGPSKVATIAQNSKIYREHLYEILKQLEQQGLVEKELAATTIYRAVPIDNALPRLIKSKQQQVFDLENRVKTLVATYEKKKAATNPPLNKPEISVTSSKSRTLQRVQGYFEAATNEILIVQTWERFIQFSDYYETVIKDALARNVHVLHIVESPVDQEQAQRILSKDLYANKNYQLRLSKVAGGNYTIIDSKQLCLSAIESKENLGQAPMMFSNYSGFVTVFRNHFELSWNTACSWIPSTDLTGIAC